MPVATSRIHTTTYCSAGALPQPILKTLRSHSGPANIIYSAVRTKRASVAATSHPDDIYITCSTDSRTDFVLACTEGRTAPLPIFIFTTLLDSEIALQKGRVSVCMEKLADALLAAGVRPERVFSVFAPKDITLIFTDLWSRITGVDIVPAPYYECSFGVCTRASFIPKSSRSRMPDFEYELRLAREEDIPEVAQLCYDFAQTSPPFVITHAQALDEAEHYVHAGALYVHTVHPASGASPRIVSILVAGRPAPEASAVTKVFTDPAWGGRGCAERLVRFACALLLEECPRLVLYVGRGNPAARVYRRVGFLGLGDSGMDEEGAAAEQAGAQWLELGFDPEVVELGHW